MTKFLDKSFSSRPASDAYREGWDAIFRKPEVGEREIDSPLPLAPNVIAARAQLAASPVDRCECGHVRNSHGVKGCNALRDSGPSLDDCPCQSFAFKITRRVKPKTRRP
jgi:hypothetical protein